MPKIVEIVLLLALPASGKSELRRYLEHIGPEGRRALGLGGRLLQLDDYPYVHFMRRVDEELHRLGCELVFYTAFDGGFNDPREWGTLIELLNQDYERTCLFAEVTPLTSGFAGVLFNRIDLAAMKVGIQLRLRDLPKDVRTDLERSLEADAKKIYDGLPQYQDNVFDGDTTVVVEFARGGPAGRGAIDAPRGYQHSIGRLDLDLLNRASVLYVKVKPEQSRAKNLERSHPGGEGSILFHGVPESVMEEEYARDDMEFLMYASATEDTIEFDGPGDYTFTTEIGVFDNSTTDLTSFLRTDPSTWQPAQIEAVQAELARAMAALTKTA